MIKSLLLSGRVWKYGSNISTDHILPSRFMTQIEPEELTKNCMSGLDLDFATKVQSGDILVAEENFGYGSSREQAPWALKYAGIEAVVAISFARIFFRNCYNIGLPAIGCETFVQQVKTGDIVEIDLAVGSIVNKSNGQKYGFSRPPLFLLDYVKAGGLIPYLTQKMS